MPDKQTNKQKKRDEDESKFDKKRKERKFLGLWRPKYGGWFSKLNGQKETRKGERGSGKENEKGREEVRKKRRKGERGREKENEKGRKEVRKKIGEGERKKERKKERRKSEKEKEKGRKKRRKEERK